MSDLIDETGSLEGSGGFTATQEEGIGEASRIVTARGTEDGLVLRIDGKADWSEVVGELRAFLGTRKKFLEGGEVTIEWLDRLPTKEQSSQLEEFLNKEYAIEVSVGKRKPSRTTFTLDVKAAKKGKGATLQLFDQAPATKKVPGSQRDSLTEDLEFLREFQNAQPSKIDRSRKGESTDKFGAELTEDVYLNASILGDDPAQQYVSQVAKVLGDDLFLEEDANAKVVFATLRSGQRVETPFSLIVVGDVNPGADLIAGGDIFILGSLRGTAHAGAYDEDPQNRVVIALQMRPMQLRIGSVISRGSDERGTGAEVARIENRRIVVEPYNPRAASNRR